MLGAMLVCGLSGHCLSKRSKRIEEEFESERKAVNRAAFKSEIHDKQ